MPPAAAGGSRVLVGGDCPVILGALAALAAERGRAGLLFVDGHEDAWPPRVSPTGEAAGCEPGLALRLFDGCAGWSVCIYNPDLDPGYGAADAIISYITHALAASGSAGPAR